MAAEPQDGSVERQRLPFEPLKRRKKATESPTSPQQAVSPKPTKTGAKLVKSVKADQAATAGNRATLKSKDSTQATDAIPQVVSQRMAQRMAVFCGIPTALGMSVFFVSYWIVTHGWFKLPNVAVIFMSLGFFGLGVLGLSYGVLSASWDEAEVGSKLGWSEFKLNLGRMLAAWRAARQQKSS